LTSKGKPRRCHRADNRSQGSHAALDAATPSEFWIKANPVAYRELAQRHLVGITEVN